MSIDVIISREEKRKELIEELIGYGWPAIAAMECANLAMNSTDMAMEAFSNNIKKGAGEVIRLQAMVFALEMISDKVVAAHERCAESIGKLPIFVHGISPVN